MNNTQLLAEAAVRRALQTRASRTWTGTVRGYDTSTNVTKVVLDGDEEEINAIGVGEFQPQTGDRVLILLAPPSAAYVIGTMTASSPSGSTTIIQQVGGGSTSGSVFDEITVGGVVVTATPPGAPTNVVAVPGAFSDQSYVDVSWANGAPASSSYQIELARRTSPGVYQTAQQHSSISASLRLEALTPGAAYGVRVSGINRLGISGAFSPYTDFTAARDTTPPPVVTGVTASRGPSSVLVSWDASTADDVKDGHGYYLVQLTTDINFVTITESELVSATVHAFLVTNTAQAYYVRVAAVDSSGNVGPFSTMAAVVAGGITGTMILQDEITAVHIAPGTITTAEIGFGVGGSNLLPNSGFENSVDGFTGWTTSSASLLPGGGRLGGGQAARLVPNGSSSFVRVTTDLPVGVYVLSGWFKANSLTASGGYGVLVGNGPTGQISGAQVSSLSPASGLTTGWVRLFVRFTVTVPGTVYTYGVAVGAGSGSVDVDDFQLEGGDIPTTYAPKVDEILPGSVGTAEIAANAITAAKIAANQINANHIAANQISSGHIIAGEIKAINIGANEVTAGKIAANAITATNIQAGAITTDKLTVAQTGDNKVLNGDFQGATYTQGAHIFPEAWGNLDTISAGATIGTGVGANGVGSALRITGGPSGAYVFSKGFPVVAGRTYVWSARFLAESTISTGVILAAEVLSSAGGYSYVGIQQSATLINNVGGTAGVWNYAEGKFTATASGYLVVRPHAWTGANGTSVRWDEISVKEVERSVTIADGAIDAVNITADAVRSTHIKADQILSTHITVGTLEGDRIKVNSLSATRLTTSTLTATTITLGAGGQFMAGSNVGGGGTGLLINEGGISLYNGATRTVHLNAALGTATLTGIINATGGQFSGAITSTATITGGTFVTTSGTFRSNDVFGGFAEMGNGGSFWKSAANGGAGHFAPASALAIATSTTVGYLEIASLVPTSGSARAYMHIWGGGKRDIDLYTPSGNVVVKNGLQVDGSSNFWNAVVVKAGFLGTEDGLVFGTRNQEGDWDELALRSIGSGTTAGVALHSQQFGNAAMVKWDGASASLFFTNTSDTDGVPVYAKSYNIVSSERFKQGITPSTLDMSKFSQLAVRTYSYKTGPTCTNCGGTSPDCSYCAGTGDSRTEYAKITQDKPKYGLIAEELARVYPELVQLDASGAPVGLALDQLIALLFQKVLEQDTKIKTLESKVK